MELRLALIRHGQAEHSMDRLVGITDEPLSETGKIDIGRKIGMQAYPRADVVYSSALARCMETARAIYPAGLVVMENDLRALDYGDFDGKSYEELAKDRNFAIWQSSAKLESFPNGEDYYMLMARSIAVFRRIGENMASNGFETVSIVTHKTVISAILQRYLVPRITYSSFGLLPGEGYLMCYDNISGRARIEHKF